MKYVTNNQDKCTIHLSTGNWMLQEAKAVNCRTTLLVGLKTEFPLFWLSSSNMYLIFGNASSYSLDGIHYITAAQNLTLVALCSIHLMAKGFFKCEKNLGNSKLKWNINLGNILFDTISITLNLISGGWWGF